MRIVLLGPPGSGKTALAKKLSRHYSIPRFNLQQQLSTMAGEETELGRLVGELLIACAPIPEELVNSAFSESLVTAREGFVLDDFPRDINQAELLDGMLAPLGAPLELAVNIHVDNDDLMERLVGQLHCESCGSDYNIYSNPPLVDGVCDMCGSRIARRPADYEETIANRLRNCEANIAELAKQYKSRGILVEVYDPVDTQKATKAVMKLIDAAPRKELIDPRDVQLELASDEKMAKPAKKRGRKPKKEKAPTKKAVENSASTSAQKKAIAKKKVVKKAPVKKAAAKKAVTKKKAPVKKAVAKKSVTKKAVTKKKAPVKKAIAKKAVTKKKAPVKKVVAKKTVTKKKAPVKKAVAKKVAVKKKAVAKKKVVAKKTVTKKAPVKKKAVAKKKVVKKAVAKKRVVVTKKTPAKKPKKEKKEKKKNKRK